MSGRGPFHFSPVLDRCRQQYSFQSKSTQTHMSVQCYNNSDNNNDYNDCTEKHNWRVLQLLHHCELSPTRTPKWPGRNDVQMTCNTLSAYHVQYIVCHVVWRDSSAISFVKTEIAFILALCFGWTIYHYTHTHLHICTQAHKYSQMCTCKHMHKHRCILIHLHFIVKVFISFWNTLLLLSSFQVHVFIYKPTFIFICLFSCQEFASAKRKMLSL